jgi:hypothetical protein
MKFSIQCFGALGSGILGFGALATALLGSLSLGSPVQAAEEVVVDLSGLELAVSVAELEDYIYRDQSTGDLALYTSFLDQVAVARTKEILAQKYALSPEELNPILQAPLIQDVFTWLGEMIQTEAGTNGSEAIQTALLGAGQVSGEIDLLTVIEAFPDRVLRIDADRVLKVIAQVGQLYQQTEEVVALMQSTSTTAATDSPQNRDLRQPGPWALSNEP